MTNSVAQADLAINLWASLKLAAERGDDAVIKLNCQQISILAKAGFAIVKRLGSEEPDDERCCLFECPKGCGHLVLHIYLPPDGEPGCRHCCELDYASRRLNRDIPEAARVAKLRAKLGAEPTPFSQLPPRKRWARRAPYLRALRAIAEQESKLAPRMTDFADDLERRAKVHKLKVAS